MIYFGQRVGIPEAVGVGLAVVAATGSYFVVERPFLRLKRRDRAQLESRDPDVPVGRSVATGARASEPRLAHPGGR